MTVQLSQVIWLLTAALEVLLGAMRFEWVCYNKIPVCDVAHFAASANTLLRVAAKQQWSDDSSQAVELCSSVVRRSMNRKLTTNVRKRRKF